ncbi:MAG: ribosomal RNA small subunit methyltransferase A [Calditrichaeota bacterium]|nr:MAG: ribosomal RNA small subunit methyltransferase A [Calditrichota bacterium]
MFQTKKSLGQNFLHDHNISRKIVNSTNPQKTDYFLEIGPGEGALTQFLLPAVSKYLAVEIDSRLIPILSEKFQDYENFKIINSDFLDFELSQMPTNLRIIGNLPYNATSPIIFQCLENYQRIQDLTIMVQKEVADRLSANYGSKTYGILSVFLSVFGEVKKLFNVPPTVFFPKPKVDSAVVQIKFQNEFELVNKDIFFRVVKASFGKRRKMISNSLAEVVKELNSEIPSDFAKLRPEQIKPEEFVLLTQKILESVKK